eukprot:COSAG03_NODE_24233_length_274_cov_0.502857_1_plen_60_part_10
MRSRLILHTQVVVLLVIVHLRESKHVHWLQVLGEGWAAPLRGFMREGVLLEPLHFNSVLR